MVIEEDKKKYWVDGNKRRLSLEKHEWLEEENYYESRSVGTRARSDKTCEFCRGNIPKGVPHTMHHFYPEFEAYPTHKECEKPFMLILN